MSNEVYDAAHQELARLISPRAAGRMLDDALATAAVSPEQVTPRQMRALVTGPLQADLRAILPHAGLSAALRVLTERLRAMNAEPQKAMPGASPEADGLQEKHAQPESEQAHAPSTQAASAYADVARRESVPSAPSASTSASDGESVTVVDRPAPAARRTVAAPLLAAGLDLDGLQRMALTFARLDHVVGVAVVQDGRVRFARGSGIDADRAAVLVPAAAAVMARQGAWRSYSLVHDRGQLFVIPIGRDHIVLAGRSEFNLGAVHKTLETLEEAI